MQTRTLGAFAFSTLLAGLAVCAQGPATRRPAAPGPEPTQITETKQARTTLPPYTAVIRGRVTSVATGKPLRAVQVSLNNAGGQPEPRVSRVAKRFTLTDGETLTIDLPYVE